MSAVGPSEWSFDDDPISLAEVAAQVRELRDFVEQLPVAGGGSGGGPRPHLGRPRGRRGAPVAGWRRGTSGAWWNLDAQPPETAAATRGEVILFGNWIRDRYAVEELPLGWHADPGLVDQTVALYANWMAAYRDRSARPEAPGQWFDALARYRSRVEQHRQARGRMNGAVNNMGSATSVPQSPGVAE